jgi:hypothetical protein
MKRRPFRQNKKIGDKTMSVTKAQRAVLIVSDLTSAPPDRDWLYNFIESGGRTTCKTILEPHYARFEKLYDSAATRSNFIQKLQTLGADPAIRAIDVIVMLHGATNQLGFRNGMFSTPTLRTQIANLNIAPKLRLLYSTACYGASHNDDFVGGGFNTSIGARKVNTNAAVELPALLGLWVTGSKIKDALAVGESPVTRNAADTAAKVYATWNNLPWKNQVDSDKVLLGDGQLRITSNG